MQGEEGREGLQNEATSRALEEGRPPKVSRTSESKKTWRERFIGESVLKLNLEWKLMGLINQKYHYEMYKNISLHLYVYMGYIMLVK